MDQLERYRGSLLGLATGDALGAPLEGRSSGSFEPVEGMIGGGSHGLPPGYWTDDTSMALCLAESLAERGFDPVDQLERYVRWFREGYLSSTGYCFGIGNTTMESLIRFEASGEPNPSSAASEKAGNGSIMRLAPVPLFYARSPMEAVERSADSSRTTHGAENAVHACRYFGALISGAVNGVSKAELLSERYGPSPGYWEENPLSPEVDEIARGSFKRKEPPEIKGSGYVVRSLEAALWAFHRSASFEEGCLMAVNLGDDADTTAAVYGQLAGALYGEGSIPEPWLAKLAHQHLIEDLAEKLFERCPGAE